MTFGGTLALIISGLALILSSFLLVALTRPRSSVETLLGMFVIGWATVSAILLALSFLHTITPLSLTIAHVVLLGLAAMIVRWARLPFPPLPTRVEIGELWRSWKLPLLIRLAVIGWLGMVLSTTLYIAAMVPTNSADSLAYHLSRAAYWRQHQSIAHYDTELTRQNEMPKTAEIGYLWTMVLTNSEVLTALLSWMCWGAVLTACYGILRSLNLSGTVSLLSVCTVASLPQVMYLSCSNENDMIASTFILVGVFFLARAFLPTEKAVGQAILSALAIGLALGTKGDNMFWGPGVLILLIWTAARGASPWRLRRAGLLCVATVVFTAAFAGYGWLENWRWYKNPFLTPAEAAEQEIQNPDWRAITSNGLKTLAWFCEPMRVGERIFGAGNLQKSTMKVLQNAHAHLGLDVSSPRTTFGHASSPGYSIPPTPRTKWMGHLGPLGFLLFWPSLAITLIAGAIACFRSGRLASPIVNCAVWSLAALSYFVTMCSLVCWRPGGGRLCVPLMFIGVPAIAGLFHLIGRTPFVVRWLLGLAIAAVALGASLEAAFQNPASPLVEPDLGVEKSVLWRSRETQRLDGFKSKRGRYPALVVDSLVPTDARLGLAMNETAQDFHMFGPRLERHCVPVPRARAQQDGPVAVLDALKLDALLLIRDGGPGGRQDELSRRMTPEGITVYEWRGGLLAIRAPLPESRFPGKINDGSGKPRRR